MSDPERTIKQAEETVGNYALFIIEGIVNTHDRETHGDGCGCNSCKTKSEKDIRWAKGFLDPYSVEDTEE